LIEEQEEAEGKQGGRGEKGEEEERRRNKYERYYGPGKRPVAYLAYSTIMPTVSPACA